MTIGKILIREGLSICWTFSFLNIQFNLPHQLYTLSFISWDKFSCNFETMWLTCVESHVKVLPWLNIQTAWCERDGQQRFCTRLYYFSYFHPFSSDLCTKYRQIHNTFLQSKFTSNLYCFFPLRKMLFVIYYHKVCGFVCLVSSQQFQLHKICTSEIFLRIIESCLLVTDDHFCCHIFVCLELWIYVNNL